MLTLLLALQLTANLAGQPAILNMPRLLAESIEGKAASAKLEAFRTEREKTLSSKQDEVKALIAKKAPAETIERSQIELRRMTEDAERELTTFQESLQLDFFGKIQPVAIQVLNEEHLSMLFTFPNPNILWTSPSVDITAKVIERLDAATKKAFTQPPK